MIRYFVIPLFLIVLVGSVFAVEPTYVNYFSNPEFQIYKIQVKAYEFSIPYQISNAELEKIVVDCDSTALIVYFKNIDSDGSFIINIPRTLLDKKLNEQDDSFIIILDQLEVEYQEINNDLNSRTLDISLRQNEKVLEIISSNVGMFPEPVPCGIGGSNESPYFKLLSPLKQSKAGIQLDKIQCREGLVLVTKSTNDSPACVKYDSAVQLNSRNWIKSFWVGASGEEVSR